MNKSTLFRNTVLLHIIAAIFFLGLTAYLGTFTRYMADDYCETVRVTSDTLIGSVVNRYMDGDWRAANRYSNLLFVGVVERLLPHSIETEPIIMIILWVIGIIWAVHEIRTLTGKRWPIPVDFFLGLLIAYISIFEAPNPYQTFYWRSSMATHFAPLVFLNLLIAFMFWQIRLAKSISIPIWIGFIIFFASFMIGGFSEPPVTVMVTGLGLSILYVWFLVKGEIRRLALNLLTWSLFGAVSALTVMALSPAVSRLEGSPSFFEWLYRTFQYTYFFMIDTVKILPLPLVVSLVTPALVFFILYREKEEIQLINQKTFYHMASAPLILALLIAAGFSTSAYGQAYPVERARFFAHYLMTITLVFEGALLGIWLSQIKVRVFHSAYTLNTSIIILFVLALYPLRAGLQIVQRDGNKYRHRAELWDKRDAIIRDLQAKGETDLTVIQFDGVDGVKELDTYETHWVNQCAAVYYNVNSIRAITIPGEYIKDYFGE